MTITAERDAQNKMFIRHSFHRALGLGLTAKQFQLINDGTPEERAAYVEMKRKQLLKLGMRNL